jgi:hypothetical protein
VHQKLLILFLFIDIYVSQYLIFSIICPVLVQLNYLKLSFILDSFKLVRLYRRQKLRIKMPSFSLCISRHIITRFFVRSDIKFHDVIFILSPVNFTVNITNGHFVQNESRTYTIILDL